MPKLGRLFWYFYVRNITGQNVVGDGACYFTVTMHLYTNIINLLSAVSFTVKDSASLSKPNVLKQGDAKHPLDRTNLTRKVVAVFLRNVLEKIMPASKFSKL
jgi:hypothetical protein